MPIAGPGHVGAAPSAIPPSGSDAAGGAGGGAAAAPSPALHLRSDALCGRPELVPLASGQSVLGLGVRGVAVEQIQRALGALGLDLGAKGADGVYGRTTERAVSRFQRDHGLTPDGRVGAETLRALDRALPLAEVHDPSLAGDPTLRRVAARKALVSRGDRGAPVRSLQKALLHAGYAVDVDGVFGAETERAIRGLQTSNGFDRENGQVDRQTLLALDRAASAASPRHPGSSGS